MTAISKAWVAIADTAVDPDSPIDAALMTGIRDDLVHVREWLGASYTAGAIQDHNHDGSNSAAITIGPNWLRNGGFESGTAGWTLTAYTGGTLAAGTSNETEGTTGLVITSTNASNGGGNAVSNEFIPITAGQTRQFLMTIKASLSNVPVKAEVLWFDDAQAQVSASTLASTTTASPTTDRLVVRRIAAPATARYCKVKCELPAAGAATGSVYFDAVIVTTPQTLGGEQVFTSSGTFSAIYGDVEVECVGGGGGGRGEGGISAAGSAGGTSSFGTFISATGGAGGNGTGTTAGGIGVGGAINAPGKSPEVLANGSVLAGGSFYGEGDLQSSLGAIITGKRGYGGGGAPGGNGATGGSDAGAGGGKSRGYVTITAGDVAVTVGSGGAGGSGNFDGRSGADGVVIVRW